MIFVGANPSFRNIQVNQDEMNILMANGSLFRVSVQEKNPKQWSSVQEFWAPEQRFPNRAYLLFAVHGTKLTYSPVNSK